MGDGQHPETPLAGRLLDPAADDPQRVDVEPGVELVEDGDGGLEHAQLQRLVALLLAARQVDVERAVQEPLVEADALGLGRPCGSRMSAKSRPLARKDSVKRSSRDTPGTSVGYCMARNSPAWARSHGASASRSTPSRVTDPPVTS